MTLPPVARRQPHTATLHGDRRVDDYAWLRAKGDPAVIAHLEAENAFADAWSAPLRGLEETLYREMLGRIRQTDLTVPYQEGEHVYWSRTVEGMAYPIHCRRRGESGAEETLLDLNQLARGHAFLGLGAWAVSDDGRLLAYAVDTTGFRVYDLVIQDLTTGAPRPERATDVGTVAWAADGTLLYVTKDPAKRPCRLFQLRLGAAAPELLYEETDERFSVSIRRTRSRAFLLLSSDSLTASEVRVRSAARSGEPWRVIAPREADHEYDLDHAGDRFLIRTNSGGRNFRLVAAPLADPDRARWTEIVPHRPDVMLEGVECFARHWVLIERQDGLTQFQVVDAATGTARRVAFPEPVYAASFDTNRRFEAPFFRYAYQSFVTPPSIFDYDMERHEATLRKRTEVLGDFDPARYESLRLHATARDGARVPISMVRLRASAGAGPRPLLLYGYGAYGIPLAASFSSNRLSLLDRGVGYAIAHVRGGGELGKEWHDRGRMEHKPNTFADFIAAAEHLIAERHTASDRLAIQGGSAGGLLVGAVLNLRPELFRVALLHVPFVDVVNTMLDPSLPLTVGEFEEWGNPARPEFYRLLRSYCPYTNLAARDYPAMLVRTSLNDSQVMYWEPAKYVARLRALKTDLNPLLFRTLMGAGHGGASGRYDALRDTASDQAFLLATLGLAGGAGPGS